jgi:hypothetical protein
MYANTLKTLGAATLLALLPAIASAAAPQGTWQGLVMQANTDVAVTIAFDAQKANLQFHDPFSCNVPARFLKDDGANTVYRFTVSTNGGRFCDSLLNRDLKVTAVAGGRLQITFDSAKVTWHGELRQANSPSP